MSEPEGEYFTLFFGHYSFFGSFIILHNIILLHISILD